MLLTMGDRELPIAMPSFCWKNLSSTRKYAVLKQNLKLFHDDFYLQERPLLHLVICTEFITINVYIQGFVDW
jgi:hypothetical protein